MNGLERRAGKFELPARLQATARRRSGCRPMMLLAFRDRLPAEALHAFQQLADAGRAVIGERLVGLEVIDEFLVLGADAPVGASAWQPLERWRTRSSRLSIGPPADCGMDMLLP